MACMSDFKMTIEITLSIRRLRLLGEQRSGGAGESRDILLLPAGKRSPFSNLSFLRLDGGLVTRAIERQAIPFRFNRISYVHYTHLTYIFRPGRFPIDMEQSELPYRFVPLAVE